MHKSRLELSRRKAKKSLGWGDTSIVWSGTGRHDKVRMWIKPSEVSKANCLERMGVADNMRDGRDVTPCLDFVQVMPLGDR
mmetsp:Transcript_53035/g.63867  ORF Transcript_53035/g.63867 Transcript_53035/m.63867 type:complete len:81 (-) Transcript_53035:175-417(-)